MPEKSTRLASLAASALLIGLIGFVYFLYERPHVTPGLMANLGISWLKTLSWVSCGIFGSQPSLYFNGLAVSWR